MICPKTPESRQKMLEQKFGVINQIYIITFSRWGVGLRNYRKDFPRKKNEEALGKPRAVKKKY